MSETIRRWWQQYAPPTEFMLAVALLGVAGGSAMAQEPPSPPPAPESGADEEGDVPGRPLDELLRILEEMEQPLLELERERDALRVEIDEYGRNPTPELGRRIEARLAELGRGVVEAFDMILLKFPDLENSLDELNDIAGQAGTNVGAYQENAEKESRRIAGDLEAARRSAIDARRRYDEAQNDAERNRCELELRRADAAYWSRRSALDIVQGLAQAIVKARATVDAVQDSGEQLQRNLDVTLLMVNDSREIFLWLLGVAQEVSRVREALERVLGRGSAAEVIELIDRLPVKVRLFQDILLRATDVILRLIGAGQDPASPLRSESTPEILEYWNHPPAEIDPIRLPAATRSSTTPAPSGAATDARSSPAAPNPSGPPPDSQRPSGGTP